MKKAVILPLVAAISGVLVGCGGGSGGGSGTPETIFNFSFAKPEDVDAATSTCTIHTRNTSDGTVLAYFNSEAMVNKYIVGYISNADGTLYDSVLEPNGGVITFDLEEIPIGGFFTFQEFGEYGNTILATSFSREFLADQSLQSSRFGMNKAVEDNDTCIEGGNFTILDKEDLAYTNVAGGVAEYHFISTQESQLSFNTNIDSITAISTEPTIVVQYDNSGIHVNQFGIGNWQGPIIDMKLADANQDIFPSQYNHTGLDIRLSAGGFLYDVVSYDATVTKLNLASETINNEAWHFDVQFDDIKDWSIDYGSIINNNQDLIIEPESLLDFDVLPDSATSVVVKDNNSTVDLETGFDVELNDNGYQRLAYRTAVSDQSINYSVTHKLYTYPQATVTVPILDYGNIGSDVAELLLPNNTDSTFSRTLYLQDQESELVDAAVFMGQFAHGDSLNANLDKDIDGIVLSEVELNRNQVELAGHHRVQVQRLN